VSSQESETPSSRTHLMVAWPAAAIGALVLAIAAATGLLIVVTKSQALATVAIILAIVAFVVQIIVFIVQMQAAGGQALHAQELHGEMQEVLAQIQERTQGTQESLEGINAKLLEAALGKSLPQAEKGGAKDEEGFLRDLALRTIETLQGGRETSSAVPAPVAAAQPVAPAVPRRRRRASRPWPRRRFTVEDKQVQAQLSTWPSEGDAKAALAATEGLSDHDLDQIIELAEDEYRTLRGRNEGDEILVPGFGVEVEALIERGLTTRTGYMSPSGSEIVSLTPEGRQVGRLLFAPDPIPPELRSPQMERLRGRVDATID
jgi:hypothetical protein